MIQPYNDRRHRDRDERRTKILTRLVALSGAADGWVGACWQGHESLADEHGVSLKTMENDMNALRRLGHLEYVHGRGRTAVKLVSITPAVRNTLAQRWCDQHGIARPDDTWNEAAKAVRLHAVRVMFKTRNTGDGTLSIRSEAHKAKSTKHSVLRVIRRESGSGTEETEHSLRSCEKNFSEIVSHATGDQEIGIQIGEAEGGRSSNSKLRKRLPAELHSVPLTGDRPARSDLPVAASTQDPAAERHPIGDDAATGSSALPMWSRLYPRTAFSSEMQTSPDLAELHARVCAYAQGRRWSWQSLHRPTSMIMRFEIKGKPNLRAVWGSGMPGFVVEIDEPIVTAAQA